MKMNSSSKLSSTTRSSVPALVLALLATCAFAGDRHSHDGGGGSGSSQNAPQSRGQIFVPQPQFFVPHHVTVMPHHITSNQSSAFVIPSEVHHNSGKNSTGYRESGTVTPHISHGGTQFLPESSSHSGSSKKGSGTDYLPRSPSIANTPQPKSKTKSSIVSTSPAPSGNGVIHVDSHGTAYLAGYDSEDTGSSKQTPAKVQSTPQAVSKTSSASTNGNSSKTSNTVNNVTVNGTTYNPGKPYDGGNGLGKPYDGGNGGVTTYSSGTTKSSNTTYTYNPGKSYDGGNGDAKPYNAGTSNSNKSSGTSYTYNPNASTYSYNPGKPYDGGNGTGGKPYNAGTSYTSNPAGGGYSYNPGPAFTSNSNGLSPTVNGVFKAASTVSSAAFGWTQDARSSGPQGVPLPPNPSLPKVIIGQ